MTEVFPPPCASLLYLDKCLVCGKPASKKCAGCSLAFYCSPQHQRSDWSRHKQDCKLYEIQEEEGIGLCLIANKKIPPGTMLVAEYPIVIYEQSLYDHLEKSSLSLQKILHIAESCPFRCPGCETGWIIGNKLHSCSKCGIPLCSAECEGSSTKHSMGECKTLRESGQREARSPAGQMVQIWRDLIIYRLIQQEKEKGNQISMNSSKWASLLKSVGADVNGNSVGVESKAREFFPLSAGALGKGQAETAYHLDQVLKVCSIALDNDNKRKLGLYEKHSLLSHSCAPNTEWWIDNDRFYYKLLARAIKPILPGERITINKCSQLDPSLIFNPTLTRRQRLQKLISLDCRCERCIDVVEKGSCLSGIRCNICKDSLSCNYYFPTNPLDKRTSWTCSGKNCKATKTFEQVLVATMKAEKELEQIASLSSASVELILSKYLDFIARHQRKVLHPCHYLIMIARSRINKAVSSFLGSGEKLFLCVVTDQPRAYDYCSYKTDYLHAYLAFLSKIYDTHPERTVGKIRYELGFAEAALLFQDFEQERMGASTFYRRLHSIIENMNKCRIILSSYSDLSGLVEDVKKFNQMLRRLFGSDFLSSYRHKCLESDESLRKIVSQVVESWNEACDAINLKRIYLNPESCHVASTSASSSQLLADKNNNSVNDLKCITKEDLQVILMDAQETPE